MERHAQSALRAALRSAAARDDAGDGGERAAALEQLLAAVNAAESAGGDEAPAAAAELLACVAEELLDPGPGGLALLDALLLDALPALAPLALRSPAAARDALRLAAAAAARCDARDAVTALLAALDSWLHAGTSGCGDDPAVLASLLAGALPLLPRALVRLGRRCCAFAAECLAPAAAAAAAVGELLPLGALGGGGAPGGGGGGGGGEGAAGVDGAGGGGSAGDAGAEEDTRRRAFVGQQWGVFFGFAAALEEQVIAREPDGAETRRARARLAAFCLSLLPRLTLGWEPAGAAGGSIDGGGSGRDAATSSCSGSGDTGHAGQASSSAAGAAGPAGGGGGGSGGGAPPAAEGPDAAELRRLLRLLVALGAAGWRVLEELAAAGGQDPGAGCGASEGELRAGAGLAALYSLQLGAGPAAPADARQLLQTACALAPALARAAQEAGSQAGAKQAVRLLLLVAKRAQQQQQQQQQQQEPCPQQPGPEASGDADNDAAFVDALSPAVALLAAAMAQAPPGTRPGRLARTAWAAVLDAAPPPGPARRASCLAGLLAGQHPEVCALLLQRATRDAARGALRGADLWRLCEPWLAGAGPWGWRQAGGGEGEGTGGGGGGGGGEGGGGAAAAARMAEGANALCAALNAALLLRLRQRAAAAAAGPSGPRAAGGGGEPGEPSEGAGLPAAAELRRGYLEPLAAALEAALGRLRQDAAAAAHAAGGGGSGDSTCARGAPAAAGAAAGVAAGGGGGGGLGESVGADTALDAWLALGRAQDAADRLAELCEG